VADPAITIEQRLGGSSRLPPLFLGTHGLRALGSRIYICMKLTDLLAEISTLDPSQLVRVRKTVDLLLGGADQQPDAWDSYVWDALRKCLKDRGLRLPVFSAIQANPDKKRKLAEGADAIRFFLQKAMQEDDDHRLRVAIPFVVSTSVSRMVKGNAPLSTSVLLNQLASFPAYTANAYPGCASNPAQFSMIRALFHKKPPVT